MIEACKARLNVIGSLGMSRRRTREQKILSTLRKLQSQQASFSTNEKLTEPTFATAPVQTIQPKVPFFQGISRYQTNQANYSYVKKDLLKIFILAILAIGIQIMLSLFRTSLKFPF